MAFVHFYNQLSLQIINNKKLYTEQREWHSVDLFVKNTTNSIHHILEFGLHKPPSNANKFHQGAISKPASSHIVCNNSFTLYQLFQHLFCLFGLTGSFFCESCSTSIVFNLFVEIYILYSLYLDLSSLLLPCMVQML